MAFSTPAPERMLRTSPGITSTTAYGLNMPVTGGRDVEVFAAVGRMASVGVGCGTVAVGATTGGVSVGTGSVGSVVGGSVGGRDVGETVGPSEQAVNVRIKILVRLILIFIFSPISVGVILAYFQGGGCNNIVAHGSCCLLTLNKVYLCHTHDADERSASLVPRLLV